MDELEFEPQTAVAVARRALILSGVVCRASLEGIADESHVHEAATNIHGWFDELGLWPYVEPLERTILQAPFSSMPEWQEIPGTWFAEGLAILAWALNRCEFPPHDRQVNPIAITDALDFLDPSAQQLLESPSLRDPAQLKASREWFYDLHCTLRGFLNHGGNGQLSSWIGQYLAVLELPPKQLMSGLFPLVDDVPLIEASRDRLEAWENIVCERHRATIWLVGEDPLYTGLTVDT